MESLKAGLVGEKHIVVSEEMSAKHFASGSLEVLSTPYMIAIMENAAYLAVQQHLEEGFSTVGTHLNVSHLAATPLSVKVVAKATLTSVDGKKLSFDVCAYADKNGEMQKIGEGTHERFIINVDKFLSKLG